VKVGQTDNGEALITEGLTAGEKVVVDGQYKLQPGSKVTVGPAPGAGPERHANKGPAPAQGSGEGHQPGTELK